jgi:hypothetical protein
MSTQHFNIAILLRIHRMLLAPLGLSRLELSEDEAPARGTGLFDRHLAFGNNSSYVS